MKKSVRSAHAEKSFNANKNLINNKFPNSALNSNQDNLDTNLDAPHFDAWGYRVESLNSVVVTEQIGAGGKFEKKVFKPDQQLDSGPRDCG